MILEVAILNVRIGEGDAFEQAFSQAQDIIASMPGYASTSFSIAWNHPTRISCWYDGKNWRTTSLAFASRRNIQNGNGGFIISMSRFHW